LDAATYTPADVEVMTPERLGHLLRHDAEVVLDRFGMFIFDEAQLIRESGRGFVLESVIAFLDYLARETDHRIVLISAAMGNAGAIAQWLSPDGQSLRHESQWRGPRPLHAAFTTQAHWSDTRTEGNAGPVWPYRHITDLSGQIRLRMADGRTARLFTQGDTGWRLVRKSKDGNSRRQGLPIDSGRSTKHYVIASEMIAALGHAGPSWSSPRRAFRLSSWRKGSPGHATNSLPWPRWSTSSGNSSATTTRWSRSCAVGSASTTPACPSKCSRHLRRLSAMTSCPT
jgi:hypothetical protein